MSEFGKMLLSTCVKSDNSLSISWYSLKGIVAVSNSVDHWSALDYCESIGVKVLFNF